MSKISSRVMKVCVVKPVLYKNDAISVVNGYVNSIRSSVRNCPVRSKLIAAVLSEGAITDIRLGYYGLRLCWVLRGKHVVYAIEIGYKSQMTVAFVDKINILSAKENVFNLRLYDCKKDVNEDTAVWLSLRMDQERQDLFPTKVAVTGVDIRNFPHTYWKKCFELAKEYRCLQSAMPLPTDRKVRHEHRTTKKGVLVYRSDTKPFSWTGTLQIAEYGEHDFSQPSAKDIVAIWQKCLE